MMLAPMPPCRSGVLAAITRAVLPPAIGPRLGSDNPALWMRPVLPDTP
jgi:hypothetical protein